MEKSKTIIKNNSFNNGIFSNIENDLNDSYYLNFYNNQTINNKTFHQSDNYIDYYEDNSNSIKSYKDFYNDSIQKSLSVEKNHSSTKKYFNLNIKKKITPLDKIENNINISKDINNDYYNDNEEECNNLEKEFSFINKIDGNFLEESSEINYLFVKKLMHQKIEDVIQKCIYLFNNYEKIYDRNIFKDTNLRCPLKEEKENDYKCECIPLIKRKRHGIVFICEKKYERYFCVDELLKFILDKQLITKNQKNICNSDNNIKKKINNENNINNKDKFLSKYNNNIMNINKNKKEYKNIILQFQHSNRYLIKKILLTIKYKHKQFNEILIEYNKKNNDKLKYKISRKISKIYGFVSEKINYFIYYFIIKRLIIENIHEINEIQLLKYKNIIKQNISLAQRDFELLKKKKTKIWNKNVDKIFKLLWIIEFFFKEEIKKDIDKKIFISITLKGYVIIYLFNF